MVQTTKNLIQKSRSVDLNYTFAIMEYNATPVSSKMDAPCKVLNCRQIKGLLLHVNGQCSSSSDQLDILLENQDRMVKDFDSKHHTKGLGVLPVGSEVLVLRRRHGDSKWIPEKILSVDTDTNASRSYTIQLANKRIVSHNRSMIRPNQTSYDLNKAMKVHFDAKMTPPPIRNDTNQVYKSKTEIKPKTKSPKSEGPVTTRSGCVVCKPLYYPDN